MSPILRLQIVGKWHLDRLLLPLTEDHWEIYQIIHQLCWNELRRFPNLRNPKDYNDRIQWLKLFDHTADHVRCSDKIRVRDYVRERVGEGYLTQIYQTCDAFDQIDFDQLPKSFVIKTNHDSGGVVLVRDKATFDRKAARSLIEKNLRTVYGWINGEWAYAFVKPKILVEEFVAPHLSTPPADFKFHCVDGNIKWLQYIYDRKHGTKEAIVSPDGEALDIHFDHNMQHSTVFEKPGNWNELCEVASKLAKGWKYVRVDMFNVDGRVVAGEMTFFPLFGCYKSKGQVVLGKLLDFDRSKVRPLLSAKMQARPGKVEVGA